ncbi:MAG: response regulator [Candidatus Lokiarchaeota archaeon]|nr:response regulator [Candidatus Lokiarchaeota archaeon]
MVSIFIVEDDEFLSILYEKALVLNGYEVIASAQNGEEAINIYKELQIKPDIIIMDHRMPIKNGLEAAEEILKIDTKTKIIFASADTTIREKAISLGAVSFKSKPFTLNRLMQNIEKVINMNNLKVH